MGRISRTVSCLLLWLPIAACDQGKGDVNLDQLRVSSVRLVGLIDRVSDGLGLQPAGAQASRDADAAKRLEIDRQLRDAALKVLLLRNRLLYEDVIGEREARETHWPAWILQPPESALSPIDLQQRYQWLSAEVQSLAAHGCKVGREKANDQKLCILQ